MEQLSSEQAPRWRDWFSLGDLQISQCCWLPFLLINVQDEQVHSTSFVRLRGERHRTHSVSERRFIKVQIEHDQSRSASLIIAGCSTSITSLLRGELQMGHILTWGPFLDSQKEQDHWLWSFEDISAAVAAAAAAPSWVGFPFGRPSSNNSKARSSKGPTQPRAHRNATPSSTSWL